MSSFGTAMTASSSGMEAAAAAVQRHHLGSAPCLLVIRLACGSFLGALPAWSATGVAAPEAQKECCLVAATGSFTARRRELGSMLRSLRVGTGLTTEQVAWQLGVSRSKISRLENGQRGANQVDILRLCELYRVDEAGRLRLTELAAEGKQRAWWSPFTFPHSEYIGLEPAASSISDWGLALVPGLLQTPEYARAVLRSGVPVQQTHI